MGREADGGIARFRALSERLGAEEIERSLYAWERDRGVYLVAAGGFVAAIPLAALYGILTVPFTVGLLLAAILMGVKAMVSDFRAWQIQQRRFGAPAEYLNHRLPRNVQIIDKDRP